MNTKMIFLASAILIAGSANAVLGQDAPTPATPSIADNASPLDNGIKMRSVELERIKREAEKTATLRRENGKELNFSLIKDDFEGIQKEQLEVVSIYTTTDPIDYHRISRHANKIAEMAVRLRGNVFEPKAEDTEAEDTQKKEANPLIGKSARDLIVALDNAIGEVVTHPMWQKLAVIDPEASTQVEASLVKVIDASNALWLEATKQDTKKKN